MRYTTSQILCPAAICLAFPTYAADSTPSEPTFSSAVAYSVSRVETHIPLSFHQRGTLYIKVEQTSSRGCDWTANLKTVGSNDQPEVQSIDEQFFGKAHINNSYFVEAIAYYLDIHCVKDDSAEVNFSYYFRPLSLPPQAALISRWMKDVGLSQFMDLRYFVVAPQSSAPPDAAEIGHLLPKPQLTVGINVNKSSDDWKRISPRLDALFGEAYQEAILRHVSLLANVPRRKIVIGFNGQCWSSGYTEGPYLTRSDECNMATDGGSLSQEDTDRLSRLSASVHRGENASLNVADANIMPGVLQTVSKFFKNRGGDFTIIERDDTYLEAISKGLHGVVVPGSGHWERVQTAVIFDRSTSSIRVQVDANWASGLAAPATNEGYDNDMEPSYSQALHNFAGQLLTCVRKGCAE
jgi:hypothetical protein